MADEGGGELDLGVRLSGDERQRFLELVADKVADRAMRSLEQRHLPQVAEAVAARAVASFADERVWPMVRDKLERGWRNRDGEGQAPLDEMIEKSLREATSLGGGKDRLTSFLDQRVRDLLGGELRPHVERFQAEFQRALRAGFEERVAASVRDALRHLLHG